MIRQIVEALLICNIKGNQLAMRVLINARSDDVILLLASRIVLGTRMSRSSVIQLNDSYIVDIGSTASNIISLLILNKR